MSKIKKLSLFNISLALSGLTVQWAAGTCWISQAHTGSYAIISASLSMHEKPAAGIPVVY